MTGKFKIWQTGLAYSQWEVYLYRITNGVTEVKKEGNRFSQWEVGSIPEGAVLIN